MSNWYLFRNGQSHGPYPEETIREWITAGQLLPQEKLCREGDQNWSSADMLPEFADVAATAPAQAPAAAPAAYAVPTTPVMPGAAPAPGAKDRTTAGILAILLGSFGVHHFYLGNTTIGIIYVVLACLGVSPLLGLVDGIVYLTKPDDQFQRNYRNWFCSGA